MGRFLNSQVTNVSCQNHESFLGQSIQTIVQYLKKKKNFLNSNWISVRMALGWLSLSIADPCLTSGLSPGTLTSPGGFSEMQILRPVES